MITIVSGFQRCGSSLMMQMLAAAGMPTIHDPQSGYPAFETQRQFHAADDPTWLTDGHAVKWLEPQRAMPSPNVPHELRIIWMRRDFNQQAKSAVKFMRLVGGVPLPADARKGMAASYRASATDAVKLWLTRGKVLRVNFEDLIREPLLTAKTVVDFLELPLNHSIMADEVWPRNTECLDGLLELALVQQYEARRR